jgi:hypothetical protein
MLLSCAVVPLCHWIQLCWLLLLSFFSEYWYSDIISTLVSWNMPFMFLPTIVCESVILWNWTCSVQLRNHLLSTFSNCFVSLVPSGLYIYWSVRSDIASIIVLFPQRFFVLEGRSIARNVRRNALWLSGATHPHTWKNKIKRLKNQTFLK